MIYRKDKLGEKIRKAEIWNRSIKTVLFVQNYFERLYCRKGKFCENICCIKKHGIFSERFEFAWKFLRHPYEKSYIFGEFRSGLAEFYAEVEG